MRQKVVSERAAFRADWKEPIYAARIRKGAALSSGAKSQGTSFNGGAGIRTPTAKSLDATLLPAVAHAYSSPMPPIVPPKVGALKFTTARICAQNTSRLGLAP